MSKQVIDLDDFQGIDVPPEVAVCPYCDEKLFIGEIDEYSKTEDGTIEPEHFSLDCVSAPDIDSPEYKAWLNWHTDMPYVHWLPLEVPVKKWLMETFEFIEGGNEREKLARWVASVKGGE